MITKEGCRTPKPAFLDQPLYRLWHTVYSSSTIPELTSALEKNFGLTDADVVDKLFKIDFVKAGYASRSVKFMRRILPFLMQGKMYSQACECAGVNHSNSLTTEENLKRELVDRLPNLQKGQLRQPIVEKILNQVINIVNAVKDAYGEADEIRVELARELKQSKDERAKATSDIAKRERDNERLKQILCRTISVRRCEMSKNCVCTRRPAKNVFTVVAL